MIERRWDSQVVARRLEEAADTLARLPDERVHDTTICGRS